MIFGEIDYKGTVLLVSGVLGAVGSLVVTVWGAHRLYKKVVMPLIDQHLKTESEIKIDELAAADRLDGEAQDRLAAHYKKLLDIKDRENAKQDRRITVLEEKDNRREAEMRQLLRSEAECKATLNYLRGQMEDMETRLRRYEKYLPDLPPGSGEIPVINP
jgi:hypothetical protein